MPDSPSDPPATQFIGTSFSSICSLLNRPALMTGFLREMLIRHFQSGNVEEPALRNMIWREANSTSILIESITRWKPQTTAKRPAVILKRNAYKNVRLGINDQHQAPIADLQGNTHYTTFWAGSHTAFCIGTTGAQAELLATEVQREFTEFASLVRESLNLMRFQVTQIGEISEIEEATESFFVPVVLGYAYEERWLLQQQAPRFSKLSLSSLIDC